MSFHTYVEEILSTSPRNKPVYIQSTKILWSLIVNSISAEMTKLKQPGQLNNITSGVVEVTVEAESDVSIVNYRRIPAYIEFYGKNSKNCIRVILSTLTGPAIIVGFYSDYEKNGKNNHFSKNTKMVNEFFIPAKIITDEEFITKACLFLLGSKITPYGQNVLTTK